MPIATGAIYIRKYFDRESKKAIDQLTHSIHMELINILQRAPWMDETTRAAAIAKANAMHFHIAYPDELVDDKKLHDYYNGLELQADSLLHNLLKIRQFNNRLIVNELRKSINKTDWQTHSMITSVNAFYSHTENSIRESYLFYLNSFKKEIPKRQKANSDREICLQDRCFCLLFSYSLLFHLISNLFVFYLLYSCFLTLLYLFFAYFISYFAKKIQ